MKSDKIYSYLITWTLAGLCLLATAGLITGCDNSGNNELSSTGDSEKSESLEDDIDAELEPVPEPQLPLCQREDTDAVCFVAIGDAGKGNEKQYQVADSMEKKCAEEGCHFALHLGDNFYPDGVRSVEDDQWETKFELPYHYIRFPFFAILGNHDNGGAIGADFKHGQIQVDYSKKSNKWYMPSRYYDFVKENVHFFGMDSSTAFFNHKKSIKKQTKWVKERINQVSSHWKIAYQHHPYLSNGEHGNAGSYEDLPVVPVLNGRNIQKLVEDAICDDFDLLITGHDHSLQVLPGTEKCPLLFVVSGAGASTTSLKENRNEAYFNSLDLGFTYFVVQGAKMHIEMIGLEGKKLFEMDFIK